MTYKKVKVEVKVPAKTPEDQPFVRNQKALRIYEHDLHNFNKIKAVDLLTPYTTSLILNPLFLGAQRVNMRYSPNLITFVLILSLSKFGDIKLITPVMSHQLIIRAIKFHFISTIRSGQVGLGSSQYASSHLVLFLFDTRIKCC